MHILSFKKIQNCYANRQGLRDKDFQEKSQPTTHTHTHKHRQQPSPHINTHRHQQPPPLPTQTLIETRYTSKTTISDFLLV